MFKETTNVTGTKLRQKNSAIFSKQQLTNLINITQTRVSK